LTYVVHRLLLA